MGKSSLKSEVLSHTRETPQKRRPMCEESVGNTSGTLQCHHTTEDTLRREALFHVEAGRGFGEELLSSNTRKHTQKRIPMFAVSIKLILV